MNAKALTLAFGLSLAVTAACGGRGGGGGPAAGKPTRITIDFPAPANPGEQFAVVLDASNGGLVSSAALTGAGTQEVTVPANGTIVFAAVLDSQYSYSGAVAPPDGTTLHFHEPFPTPTPTPAPSSIETWNVTLSTPPANAVNYAVYGPCGSYNTSSLTGITVDTQNCTAVATAKLLAVALDNNCNAIGWGVSPVQTVAPGSTANVTIALDQTNVTEMMDLVQGVPDPIMYVFDEISIVNPYWIQQPSFYASGPHSPGTPSVGNVLYVPAVEGSAMLFDFVSANDGYFVHQRPLAAVPGSVTFDVSAFDVPAFPVFDAPSSTFNWEIQPGFGQGLTFYAGLSSIATPSIQVRWSMAMEPGAQHFALPELPASLSPPIPFDVMYGYGYASETDYASQPTYGEFLDRLDFPNFVVQPDEETVSLVAQQPI